MAEGEAAVVTAAASSAPFDVVKFICWGFIVELVSIALVGMMCLWLKPEGGAYAIADFVLKTLASFATANFGALATAAKVRA